MRAARPVTRFVLLLLICATARTATAGAPAVQDVFGRDVSAAGLTLTDWDGYMANPAIEFSIAPPAGAALPVKVTVTAREPRMYFDLPSEAGAQGPRKVMTLAAPEKQFAWVCLFPARKKRNFGTSLHFELLDARAQHWELTVPVHVVASETDDHSPTFPITVDFSQDKTGFFKDEAHRAVVEQAARDWAFYLADMHLKPVAARSEETWIFDPDGFTKGHTVVNERPYAGYLLYVYGIAGPEVRSGGEPSHAGAFQRRANEDLPIHCSGGLEVEIRGNYNTLGWLPPFSDDEWWKGTNYAGHPCDLYSVVHHEMGHALIFNPANRTFPRGGTLADAAIRSYLSADPKFDSHDHFDGAIDPVSLRGGFGYEFHGYVPLGRWLITKLDLLAAQAIGYKLRPVGPFAALTLRTDPLPDAQRSHAYSATARPFGGVPSYDWTIAQGQLPPGLSLNRFTGEISGQPNRSGTFNFTLRLRDSEAKGAAVTRPLRITVG